MSDEKKPEMETIRAYARTSPGRHHSFEDPKGNEALFPNFIEKFNAWNESRPRQAIIQDAKGNELCRVAETAVFALRKDYKPTDADRLIAGALKTYSFEAPAGSIPNLCPKKSAPTK